MGDGLLAGMAELLKHSFIISREEIFDPSVMGRALGKIIFEALWLFMPFFVLMIVAGIASGSDQGYGQAVCLAGTGRDAQGAGEVPAGCCRCPVVAKAAGVTVYRPGK